VARGDDAQETVAADAALGNLIEDRDHIRIQLSLLEDSSASYDDQRKALRAELSENESLIYQRQREANRKAVG
jgi:hypothetical protein